MPAIDQYLAEMLQKQGTVLHLRAGQPIRFRIGNTITPADDQAVYDAAGVDAMLREIAPDASFYENFQQTRRGEFTYEPPNSARFRCCLLFDQGAPGAVFRLLPEQIPDPAALGLSDGVVGLTRLSGGLVLISCADPAIRASILASLIQQINAEQKKHIITLEKPIEFQYAEQNSFIIQREIGRHSRSFAAALRSAKSARPDVLMVSELSDGDSIRLALECAAGGMLVFAGMNTGSAAAAITAQLLAFPEREQNLIRSLLAETLRGILSIQLCATPDGGKIPAPEILLYSNELSEIIREGRLPDLPDLMDSYREYGMISLDASILNLLNQGFISAQEAFRKIRNKQLLMASAPAESEAAAPSANA